MAQVRFFLIAILVLECVSCKERSAVEKVQGFWVHADIAHGKYYSISVKDSTVDVDKFGRYSERFAFWPIEDIRGDTIDVRYAFETFDVAGSLIVRGDTLIRLYKGWDTGRIEQMKYVRGDSLIQFPKLLFGDADLLIRLPDEDSIQGESFTVQRKSLLTVLLVGYVKTEMKKFLPEVGSDSIAIQADDVLIGLADLDAWVRGQQDLIAEAEHDYLIVQMNIDRKVPDQFINTLREVLRKSRPKIRVCAAGIDSNRNIVLKIIP